jgi:dihydropteroate synthase
MIQVMGILNVTPDSFSDGGSFNGRDKALRQALQMVADGASYIDVGGESTRPGAAAVSLQEELDRVIPVLEGIAKESPVALSVDTCKAAVMREAIRAGVRMVNDVKALRDEGALAAVAQSTDVQVCLMHMQGEPRTMQQQPQYHEVVTEVQQFLAERVHACEQAGIVRQRIFLDPGFGFGKSLGHNYQLLRQLERLQSFGLPLLVGMSRKSMLGAVIDRAVDERLAASIAAATIAAIKGAQIIRVHDVRETVEAMKIVSATMAGEYN